MGVERVFDFIIDHLTLEVAFQVYAHLDHGLDVALDDVTVKETFLVGVDHQIQEPGDDRYHALVHCEVKDSQTFAINSLPGKQIRDLPLWKGFQSSEESL